MKTWPVLDSEQKRDFEKGLMRPPGVLCHEVAQAICQWLANKKWLSSTITIMCGPGFNGGDGYALALALYHEHGIVPQVVSVFPPRHKDIQAMSVRLRACGIEIVSWQEMVPTQIVVEALFGIGGRALDKGLANSLESKMQGALCIAVDCPAGIKGDVSLRADYTLAVGAVHPLCVTGDRLAKVGQLDLIYPFSANAAAQLWVEGGIDDIEHAPVIHKYQRGKCVILGGGSPYQGALHLAGRAALLAGAGVVVEVMEDYEREGADPRVIVADVLSDDSRLYRNANVYVWGVGMGSQQLLPALMPDMGQVHVIDAGALPFADALQGVRIMTPHEGEAARLLGISAQEVRENRIEVSMKLATIYSATVLLKGPGPICASADGVIIFPLASADLAVAGSGDILAGMIGGFCASGMDVGRACLKALSIQKKVVQLGKGAVNWRSYEAAMGY